MTTGDMDFVARKIVALEQSMKKSRARQLPSSSVRIINGEDVEIAQSVENAFDAAEGSVVINDNLNDLGDIGDSEAEYGSEIPVWIQDGGRAGDTAWDQSQFAADLALTLETELAEANQILDQALIDLQEAMDESAAARTEAQQALDEAEAAVRDAEDAIEAALEGIVSTQKQWAVSSSPTEAPASGWSATAPAWAEGQYIWERVVSTKASGTSSTSAPVVITGNPGTPGQDGAPGSTGATGTGVSSVTPYFRLGTSAPAKPTTLTPTGWSTTEPAYVPGSTNNLYVTVRTVLTTNAFTYSDVSLDSAYAAGKAAHALAQTAQTTADGKNKVVRSAGVAASPGSYQLGDSWWQFSGSQIIAMWLHNGSAWVAQTLTDSVITNLNAGTITAGTIHADRIGALSITAGKLAADSVIADKIAANAVTAVKINASAVTAAKIAANAVTAEKINAGAVTTDKLFAGAVTADKIAAEAITADKIVANAITGEKLQATSIDGMNITGAVLRGGEIYGGIFSLETLSGVTTVFSDNCNTVTSDWITFFGDTGVTRNTSTFVSSPASLNAELNPEGWFRGIQRRNINVTMPAPGDLTFWVRPAINQTSIFVASYAGIIEYQRNLPANTWTKVSIPLNQGVSISTVSMYMGGFGPYVADDSFSIDDMRITAEISSDSVVDIRRLSDGKAVVRSSNYITGQQTLLSEGALQLLTQPPGSPVQSVTTVDASGIIANSETNLYLTNTNSNGFVQVSAGSGGSSTASIVLSPGVGSSPDINFSTSTMHSNRIVKTLWSGVWFMHAGQQANLSELVSDQLNGIILVWSRYSGGTAHNDSWNYTYIPKAHTAFANGSGVSCMLSHGTASATSQKYIYVSDDKITGNNFNSTAPNNWSVLRRVLGY